MNVERLPEPQLTAVVGSRDFRDPDLLRRSLDLQRANISGVISGGAYGPDQWAEQWAHSQDLPVWSYRPHRQVPGGFRVLLVHPDGSTALLERVYGSYGQCAYARNSLIVDAAERMIAFWNGSSMGTMHSIDLARKAGKPVDVVVVQS